MGALYRTKDLGLKRPLHLGLLFIKSHPMYIEWLKFRVQPELRSQFIEIDQHIWTTALAQNPAFVRKEVWVNPTQSDEVITTIYWSNRDQWKAIPVAELEHIEHNFQSALGADVYELIEAKEYQLELAC